MKSKNKSTVLVDIIYCPDKGAFAKSKIVGGRHKIDYWYYCRERFHKVFTRVNLFFFCANYCSSVIAFMQKIEDQLNVEPRSEYGLTQRKKVMWIKPSKWWMQYAMRRSLFTIFLRSGLNYTITKDNLKEALLSEKYFTETKYALMRFLSGYTRYTGHKRGWYRQFGIFKPTADQIDKLLVKPVNN